MAKTTAKKAQKTKQVKAAKSGKAVGSGKVAKAASHPPSKPVKAKPATAAKSAKPAPPKPAKAGKGSKAAAPAKPTAVAKTQSGAADKASAAALSAAKPAEGRKNGRSTPERSPASKSKMLSKEFLMDLAVHIRDAVAPSVQAAKGRDVVGSATSGDATFQIDKVAEKALIAFLRQARAPVAYYSEDAGYTTFTSSQPENLLIVDPIDGTRAAKSGFEGCVVAVGSTRIIERPRLCDVDNACVAEIVTPRTFYAERGKGARCYIKDQYRKPKLSTNTDLETVCWSMTVPARPAELIFPTAAKLIDLTSLKGGFFACNSTSFSLTRLLTNQLDACVDFANRFLRDIPEIVEDQFINAGRGMILGIAPYDIAASLLIAREAGAIVTDAFGQPLDEVLLLDSSVSNHRSMIAAANQDLHEKLFSFFDTRIRQFELLLKRRAKQG